jgi:hypothetical protein
MESGHNLDEENLQKHAIITNKYVYTWNLLSSLVSNPIYSWKIPCWSFWIMDFWQFHLHCIKHAGLQYAPILTAGYVIKGLKSQ